MKGTADILQLILQSIRLYVSTNLEMPYNLFF